jgi:hypothetical protein
MDALLPFHDQPDTPHQPELGITHLAEAIGKPITDPARVTSEQTRFLLAELVALFEADGLLSADDTVVAAARAAWPEYQRRAAYICQPNRAFRAGLKYFGFYAKASSSL